MYESLKTNSPKWFDLSPIAKWGLLPLFVSGLCLCTTNRIRWQWHRPVSRHFLPLGVFTLKPASALGGLGHTDATSRYRGWQPSGGPVNNLHSLSHLWASMPLGDISPSLPVFLAEVLDLMEQRLTNDTFPDPRGSEQWLGLWWQKITGKYFYISPITWVAFCRLSVNGSIS